MRLGEDGRGGGAVTGHVGGLRSDLADHLRAHVLESVGELDLLGDGDAVLGDGRRTELLLEHDVAALGAEGDLDCVGELVDARQQLAASLLGSRRSVFLTCSPPTYFSMMARISSSRTMVCSSSLILMSWPVYLPMRTRSALLDGHGQTLAVVVHLAVADRDHLGLLRLFFGGIRDDDASAHLFVRFRCASGALDHPEV